MASSVRRRRRGGPGGLPSTSSKYVPPIHEHEVHMYLESDNEEEIGSTNQSHGEEDLGIVHLDDLVGENFLDRTQNSNCTDTNIDKMPSYEHTNSSNNQKPSPTNNNQSTASSGENEDTVLSQQPNNNNNTKSNNNNNSEQTCGENEDRFFLNSSSSSSISRSASPPMRQSLREPPKHGLTADKWSKLQNLAALYEQGFILETEFKERRSQLIDELTGTRSTMGDTGTSCSTTATSQNKCKVKLKKRKSRVSSSIVVPRAPPDFSVIPAERAVKHYFNLSTRTWHTEEVLVRLDDTPFARGGLRLVYHLQEVPKEGDQSEGGAVSMTMYDEDVTAGEGSLENPVSSATAPSSFASTNGNPKKRRTKKTSYVAKIAIDPKEDPSTYFRDVEMQAHCAHYARLFNTYSPPRAVEFCKAWILELVEREGRPLCAVERFVSGDYRKHNNNYGYVSEDERNTPQAFSHFSFEASAHTMLVVDIQGVSDLYTDPQIHTVNGTDFGKGNLGIKGFEKFMSTHRCNRICRYLKLPPVNPKYSMDGTIPNLPFMPATKINKSHFREGHYFEETPALQKYLMANNILKPKARRGGRKRYTTDSSESDSFLRFWSTRERDDSYCSFSFCTIL